MRTSRMTALGALLIAITAHAATMVSTTHYPVAISGGEIPPSNTVYTCDYASATSEGGWAIAESCTSVSTTLAEIQRGNSSPTVVPSPIAGKRHIPDAASVLEARMERKFGMEPRTVPASSEITCSTVSPPITSVVYTTIVPNCTCSSSSGKFPLFHNIPSTTPAPADEIAALSIVAGMLTQEIAMYPATVTPSPVPSNLIPMIVSILTANLSVTSSSNVSVTSASLTSATSNPTSEGILTRNTAWAGTVAAIGVISTMMWLSLL